jgi:hypothetical protein
LECENRKIGTMFACLDLKFHKELKLLINLKTLLEKSISIFLLLFLEELLGENERFQCYFLSLFQTYASLLTGK